MAGARDTSHHYVGKLREDPQRLTEWQRCVVASLHDERRTLQLCELRADIVPSDPSTRLPVDRPGVVLGATLGPVIDQFRIAGTGVPRERDARCLLEPLL